MGIDLEELEYMFINIIESNSITSYRGQLDTYKWPEKLIINNKKIDNIIFDGDNFNIIWYNSFEEPEPLDYYKKEINIEPNIYLIMALFGTVIV